MCAINMYKRKFLTEMGFTLIELMVVVSVIGILAAVAIPGFKKYKIKSRASEAPLALASYYTGQKELLGHFSSFAPCINAIKFSPPSKGYFVVGVDKMYNDGTTLVPGCDTPGTDAVLPTTGGGAEWINTNPRNTTDTYGAPMKLKVEGNVDMSALVPAEMTANSLYSATTYTAIAVGSINAESAVLNVWWINSCPNEKTCLNDKKIDNNGIF